MSSRDRAGTMSVRGSTRTLFTRMGLASHSGRYTSRGMAWKKTMATFCRKKDTPMALISAEMRGASRSGRYATRSTMMPMPATRMMEAARARGQGRWKRVTPQNTK